MPVVALALLGAGVALSVDRVQGPAFRARTRVAIEPSQASDWGQTQAIREIMRGYSEDIATLRMAQSVSDKLQLDLPPNKVLELLSVGPNEDLYDIRIDVRHPDHDTAAAVSRTWAELFVRARTVANLELDARDRIYARIRDRTLVEPLGASTATSGLAGFLIGGLVGLGLAASDAWRARARLGAAPAEVPALLAGIPAGPAGSPG